MKITVRSDLDRLRERIAGRLRRRVEGLRNRDEDEPFADREWMRGLPSTSGFYDLRSDVSPSERNDGASLLRKRERFETI